MTYLMLILVSTLNASTIKEIRQFDTKEDCLSAVLIEKTMFQGIEDAFCIKVEKEK